MKRIIWYVLKPIKLDGIPVDVDLEGDQLGAQIA